MSSGAPQGMFKFKGASRLWKVNLEEKKKTYSEAIEIMLDLNVSSLDLHSVQALTATLEHGQVAFRGRGSWGKDGA